MRLSDSLIGFYVIESGKPQQTPFERFIGSNQSFQPVNARKPLKTGVALYHATREFVDENADALWQRWQDLPESKGKCAAMLVVDDLINGLRDRASGFSTLTYESAIQGAFFYWHVL